jgi:peptidyl-dipeptidase Dcp
MDADTREAFREAGDVFHKTTAASCESSSSRRATPRIAPRPTAQFRGRDPDVGALLRKRGFPTK